MVTIVETGKGAAFAYESITVSTVAIGFTLATLRPTTGREAASAFVTSEDDVIRWRMDGTNPTTTEGHVLAVNSQLLIEGINNIRSFRAIRDAGTDVVLKVTYTR